MKRLANILLLASWLNSTAQNLPKHPSSYVAATAETIRRDHACLHVFAGLSKLTTEQSEPADLRPVLERRRRLTLILSPGCESATWGIWPDFSKDIHFEFALSGEAKGDSTQSLKAELVGDYLPVWAEAASVRTLEFNLRNFPASANQKFAIITVFSADTKLAELRMRIGPKIK
jgi:hypothetical protein